LTTVRAAALADISPGQPTLVELEGQRVALIRIGDTVYACGDICAHRGGYLSEGRLTGTRLACPLHGWLYDVRTGQCVFPGRGASVPSFPVQVRDGDVFVEL
jgi:nitrite reductase/ring-hydroxylating ferredoxin subunit